MGSNQAEISQCYQRTNYEHDSDQPFQDHSRTTTTSSTAKTRICSKCNECCSGRQCYCRGDECNDQCCSRYATAVCSDVETAARKSTEGSSTSAASSSSRRQRSKSWKWKRNWWELCSGARSPSKLWVSNVLVWVRIFWILVMEWMGRPWQGCLAGWNHIVRVKLTFGRYGRAPLFSCSLFDDGQYAVHSTSREEVSECNSIIPQ